MRVELVASDATAVPGQDFWAGVIFEPEEHWHIYWKNPGDSGTPPSIKWKLPAGATSGDIRWPAPHRLPLAPLMDFGYPTRTLLATPITGLPGGAVQLEARVDWLVCRESCVPGRAELKLVLPTSSPRPQEFERTRALYPEDGLSKTLVLRDASAELIVELPPALAEAPEFFPADANQIDNAAPQVLEKPATPQQSFSLLKLRKSDQLSGVLNRLRGVIEYGPPGKRQALEIQARGPQSAAPVGEAPGTLFEWLRAILFAFLGGMILNLMPCVFPVLSIKVLAFMSQKDHHAQLQRRHALVYAVGIVASFWGLTGLLLALRAAGEQVGWGFQLQSPPFVAALACVLFFLGLSLAGVFEIGGSLLGVGRGLISGEGYASSFFTGVLATVVATPCTAPLMGSAVGFALGQPLPVVFAVFTALAFGLAFPYVALAWFPAFGKVLPRPGRWMETFKQLMSFPVFGTVIWLVWVYVLQTDAQGVLRLLGGLLLISLGGWAMGRYPSRKAAGLAVALGALGFWVAISHGTQSKWESYTAARVAELRAQHQSVLVDFTAAWCVSCKVNELIALQSSQVAAEFERKKINLIKGDWTLNDPQITETLRQFGRSGVPFYILYYFKDGAEQVVTLPEVLTPQVVLQALEKIPN
jgi:DsbC/DsbD-like thiol-disulfide interchange protein/cytochrome c biogenesis protein CcdA